MGFLSTPSPRLRNREWGSLVIPHSRVGSVRTCSHCGLGHRMFVFRPVLRTTAATGRGPWPTPAKDRRGGAVHARQSPVCGLSRSQQPCLHQRPTPWIPSCACPSVDGGSRRMRRLLIGFGRMAEHPGRWTAMVPLQSRHFLIVSTRFDGRHRSIGLASNQAICTNAAR